MKPKLMMAMAVLLILSVFFVSCEPKVNSGTVEETQAQESGPAAAEIEAVSEPETVDETAEVVEEDLCLTSCEEITPENITLLQQVAQVGIGRITDIAASPDSAHLAVAVMTGVYIFDTQSLEELFYIADGTLMYSVAYAPDGSDLAVGSYDAVYFYSASTYEKRASVEGAYGTVSDLIYSPNEVMLGAQVANRRVMLIDPLTLEDTQISAQNWFTRFAFSPDGSQVHFSSSTAVEMISISDGQAAGELNMGDCMNSGQVTLVAETQNEVFACDSTFSLFSGGKVSLTNPAGTQTGATISVLASDPSGSQKIAAGRLDGSVQVWDSSALEAPLWESPLLHPTSVTSLAFLPNGTLLFSASNTEVRKWDASSGEDMGVVLGFSNPVNQVSFSSDGSKLVYVSSDGVYELTLDACYGQNLTPTLLTELSKDMWTSTISSDQSTLAAIVGVSTGVQYEYDMSLWIIELRMGGGVVKIPLGGGYSSKHAVFSPDGQMVAIGVDDTICLYDLSGAQVGGMLTQEGD